MRVIVIGGSGHIGTYLSPRLVEAGHDVVCVSRGRREPYPGHEAWKQIDCIALDRTVEESEGTFGQHVAELGPDVAIDLTCYTIESARQLVDALRDRVQHFLHCGTIWVHGHSVQVLLHCGNRASTAVRRLRMPQGCDRGVSSEGSPCTGVPGDGAASRASGGTRLVSN